MTLAPLNPTDCFGNTQAMLSSLQRRIPVASAYLAVTQPARLHPKHTLATLNCTLHNVQHYCKAFTAGESSVRRARRSGLAYVDQDDSSESTPAVFGSNALLLLHPAGFPNQTWWLLALTPENRTLSLHEARQAQVWLRQLNNTFEQALEPGTARVLITETGELLHHNTAFDDLQLTHPTLAEQLKHHLRHCVQQYWPHIPTHRELDCAVAMAGCKWWLRLWKRQSLTQAQPGHWFVELRPLHEQDLPTLKPDTDPRVMQAVGYIHQHYPASPSLEQIAQHVGTSPYHFQRVFTQVVGMSPKHYLQRKQMQIACWQLTATRKPVREIARAAGFHNHGHFASTFKSLRGVSPSHFRESQ